MRDVQKRTAKPPDDDDEELDAIADDVSCVRIGMDVGPEKWASWCGRDVEHEWHFLDAGHASRSARAESRPQVCKACVQKIGAVLYRESKER